MSATTPRDGHVADDPAAEVGSLAEQAGRLAEELWHRWAAQGESQEHQDREPCDRQRQGQQEREDLGEPGEQGPRRGSTGQAEQADQAGPTEQDERHHHLGTGAGWGGGSSCRLCPLCRLIDQVRESRPEVVGQMATVAQGIADLLHEFARSPATDEAPTRAEAGSGEAASAPGERGTRIDVVDDESDAGGAQP